MSDQLNDAIHTVEELRDRLHSFHTADGWVDGLASECKKCGEDVEKLLQTMRRAAGEGQQIITGDNDLTKLSEAVMRGVDSVFQVRFTNDLMEQANARTPHDRLKAVSMYFSDAHRMVEEMLKFCFASEDV
jgi:hypothetical protein